MRGEKNEIVVFSSKGEKDEKVKRKTTEYSPVIVLSHISIDDIDGGGICVIMGGGSSGFLPLCMLSALGSELAVFARCHARHGLEHA